MTQTGESSTNRWKTSLWIMAASLPWIPQPRAGRQLIKLFNDLHRGGLAHPNLVAAYDAGQAEGVPYLVLEFVGGHDLAWIVQQRGPLPAAEACEVVRRAALGLEHL